MAEIDLTSLFPRPMGRPVTVREAFSQIVPGEVIEPSPALKKCIPTMVSGKGGINGMNRWFFNTKKLHWDKPSNNINKEHVGSRAGLVHPSEDRLLGLGEFQRLQSFPDDFIFRGKYKDIVPRIGNSVPPLMAYAISAQIRHILWGGGKPQKMDATMDYPAHLETMWQKHLAPREPDAPIVISTFAGGGGSSLGYSMAGYRELLAVEWDNNAVETFRLNFPDVPIYHGDIAKLSVEECLELAGIEPGELDLFDGSPPCQGFSTAGKRILDDPRNQLFREYVRLLRGLQPKVFVMENVSGMVKGKMKLVFAEILRELKASGYRVSARLLNAMYFHVPQSRQRMIFIGVREDLEIEPSHPKAESRPIAVKNVIPGLLATRSQRINPRIDALAPSATICKMAEGYQVLSDPSDLREAEIKSTWQMARVLKGLEKHKHFGLVRREPDKPSPTITKDAGNTTAGLCHPFEVRKLTIPEIKRLTSYPDAYQMIGDFKRKWERIGNSVPPLMAEAIGRHILQNILNSSFIKIIS